MLTAYYGADGNKVSLSLSGEDAYITKAVVEAVIADAVAAAKTEVQKVATAQSAAADTDAKVATAVTEVQAKGEAEIADLTSDVVGDPLDFAKILAKQLDASKKAAKAELEAYTTTQYSDDTDDWSITVADNPTGYQGKYNPKDITGIAAGTVLSAKAFVETVISTSLATVEGATSGSGTPLANIATARKIASNVINGHKIAAAPEDFYMEPVPTKADLEADTSVEAAKAYAINKMEAALATKIADMKEIATDLLNAENKNAKPNSDKVAAYNAFLAEVDAQAAAAKEVFTAQINAQKTTAAVYTKDNTNAIDGGKLKAILDEIKGYSAIYANDEYGCTLLAAKVDITKNVDKLEDYANTLASLVDREGKPMYDANAIKDALADASENLYLDNGVGTYNLANAKADVNAAANVSDTLILQKDKFIDVIEGTEGTYDSATVTPIKLGTKTYDAWPGASAYEGAQKDAYKAVVAKTIDAIMAAASYDEIVNAFVAGCKEYDPIITADEHDADWTDPTGALYKEYVKTYKTDLEAYKTYATGKLDATTYSKAIAATAAINADIKEIVEKAYTKEELPAQIAAAKAYLDGLKSNDELNAAKKEVEALITALPSTVTLADAEQILAAKAACEDYMELAGADAPDSKLALENDVKALAALQLKEINDQVAAITKAGVTVDSEATIDALADAVDAYETNYEAELVGPTAGFTAPTAANTALYDNGGFYDQLSDAQVDAVAKQCAAVSLNPTTAAELAAVKAAKAAFEGLSIHQQAALIDNYNAYYDKLSQAEKVLGEAVKTLKITASSSAKKGSITVKWTVKGDATAVEGYEIWKSTKHSSGYKKAFTTTKKTYKNTKGLKKGTRYYYKVRAFAYVDGTKITSDWSNKARRIAK